MKKRIFAVATIAVALVGFKYRDDLTAMGLKFVAPAVSDLASIYSPEAGEIVYNTGVSKFYGRDHNSNWVQLSAGDSVIPAGTILPYGGKTVPNGYLPCDGSAVSRTTYKDLHEAIEENFGQGDGLTTFNVPDLRGRFLRGVAEGQPTDPDRATRTEMAFGGNTGDQVGSVQSDAFQSHTHAYASYGSNFSIANNYADPNANGFIQSTNGSAGSYTSRLREPIQWGGFGTPRVSSETRPSNANVKYIIKY